MIKILKLGSVATSQFLGDEAAFARISSRRRVENRFADLCSSLVPGPGGSPVLPHKETGSTKQTVAPVFIRAPWGRGAIARSNRARRSTCSSFTHSLSSFFFFSCSSRYSGASRDAARFEGYTGGESLAEAGRLLIGHTPHVCGK